MEHVLVTLLAIAFSMIGIFNAVSLYQETRMPIRALFFIVSSILAGLFIATVGVPK